MICERCGRDNPEQLTFCQDCGRRLSAPAPIVVPPTPPTGLPLFVPPLDPPPPPPPAPKPSGIRPEAPQFSFGAPREDEGPICTACGTRNPGGNRFCVSCGSRLEGPAGAIAAAVPAAAPPAPQPSPLVGAPVLNLSPEPPPAAPPSLACPRCNGSNDAAMRFCKYCGSPLRAEAAVPERKPARPDAAPGPSGTAAIPPAPGLGTSPISADEAAAMAGATPRGPVPMASSSLAAAPALQAPARLVAIAKDGSEGSKFALSEEQVDLGREEGTVILPDDPYISPRHLRFSHRGGHWYVRDLGSLNGAYLRIREPHPLVDSDLLLVGLQVLRFEAVNDAEQGFGPATQHGTLLFGSPIVPRHTRLCQRTVEGVTRNVFHLHREETVIGRESGDIVFTDDPFLSRRHLVIRRDATTGKTTVEDLGSSNGTYVAIRGEVALPDGSYLRVGQHLFRFDILGAAGAARRGS